MPLQNFVDKVGPVVSAAWLNMVDVLATTVFNNAATPAAAKASLGIFVAGKLVTTSRSNTAVGANDPELIISVPGPGTYAFQTLFSAWGTTTNTQGLSWGMNYSGSFNSNSVQSIASPDSTISGSTFVAASPTTLGFGIATTLSTTPFTGLVIMIEGSLIATSAGTFGLSWAQGTSNANATNIGLGGYLQMLQVA